MIYFDNNKLSYGFEIPNPIATIDLSTWNKHCLNECGTTWDIINGRFTDLTETPEYIEVKLKEAKAEKLQENATKRDEHLIAGVVYKDVLFDSDTDSKANLLFASVGMYETQTVIWLGKDNQPLECNKQDIYNIGNAIGDMTVNVWAVKNPYYLQAIENAETIEQLNEIVIDYGVE